MFKFIFSINIKVHFTLISQCKNGSILKFGTRTWINSNKTHLFFIVKNDVAKFDFVLFILCKSNITPELSFIVFPTHSLGTMEFYTYTLTEIIVGILKSVTATIDIGTQCTRTVTVGTNMQTYTDIQYSCLALSLLLYRYEIVNFCASVLVFFDNHHSFETHYRDYRGGEKERGDFIWSIRKRGWRAFRHENASIAASVVAIESWKQKSYRD